MAFEQIDIPGDVGIRAWGSSCAEAFAEAALGMYSLITAVEAVAQCATLEVAVSASTIESLLIKFLNELIFQFDAHGFVGVCIEVIDFSDHALMAQIHGEQFDAERHEQRLLLKAATYHNIEVVCCEEDCSVTVIFDM